jgi:hypothetical protein
MKKYLFYLFALAFSTLFFNACDDSTELEIEKKIDLLPEEVSDVKDWYNNKSIKSKHSLLQYSERLDWTNAVITCSELQNIVEVPIVTGDRMTIANPDQLQLNIVSRMVFFGNDNSYYASLIVISSVENSIEFLSNTSNINYCNISEEFDGNVSLFDRKFIPLENNIFINGVKDINESRVKNISRTCYVVHELFSDGTKEYVGTYCVGEPESGGGGSYGGGTKGAGDPKPDPTPAPAPLPSPKTPIESIEEYLDCIDRSLPATLTIYVDQALANTDNAYWGRTAGHCFVGITQNGNESIFGFHPKDGAKEEGPNTSILGDDSGRSYDVSITIEISANNVSQALYYAHNYPNVYDLSDFNCTDFAINMAAKGGITLPDTYKSWPSGGGSCPGQLGQDIRKMTLPAGVTPNYSGGDAPNNIKTCK